MNTWLNYIIEANAGLVIFLLFYKAVLSREGSFGFRRMFLLAGLFVSLLFPLLNFSPTGTSPGVAVGHVIPPEWLPEIVVGEEASGEREAGAWTYILIAYWTGFILLAYGMLVQVARLLALMHPTRSYAVGRMRVSESDDDQPTFSFFSFIFIGKAHSLSEQEKKLIILHEKAHAARWHSMDILLINAIGVLFWFNPLIRAYKKTLVEVHEYEADARTVETTDVNEYCSLLAKVALQSANYSLANHFNHSLTVKRIEMMKTIKYPITRWKVALCACLLPACFVAFSCQDQLGKGEALGAEVTAEVDQQAAPPESFYDMLRKNIRYPAESRTAHKYGQVLVRFVVNEDGTLSDYELLKTPDEALGQESLRILALSEPWQPAMKKGDPVKQTMVLPVQFKLDFPGMDKEAQDLSGESLIGPEPALKELVVVGYASK